MKQQREYLIEKNNTHLLLLSYANLTVILFYFSFVFARLSLLIHLLLTIGMIHTVHMR